MKIAIMSDSHDNWTKLQQAVEIANQANCEILLFAGDLIAPPMLSYLQAFNGKVHFVWGNNEGEKVKLTRLMDKSENITLHGEVVGDYYEDELDGIKIFMQHYPKVAELAAASGQYDLVIHGHTHVYREEQIGNTLLINPGEIQGAKTGESTFVIYDTQTKANKKITIH
jgi:putative phosphoesterase